jgi:hypothetical protein
MFRTSRVLVQFAKERRAQNDKWGKQDHPDGTGLLGDKERADHARATCQGLAAHGKVAWRDILYEEVAEAFAEKDICALREELKQVGAVTAAWMEHIEERIIESIDDKISEWHDSPDDNGTLAEYLRMTDAEYFEYINTSTLPDNYRL